MYKDKNKSPYYVWRRNDGLVSSSRYPVSGWTGTNGEVVSFQDLGTFQTWDEAVKVIDAHRALRSYINHSLVGM
jgi:hypothetical protein